MSGLCGIYNFRKSIPVISRDLKRMTQMLLHRGADKVGYYVYQNVGLGFQQTAPKETKYVHQPLANEKESVWVICDGQFYNYSMLRTSAELKKYLFFTKSPAELLLRLYEEFESNCLKKLEGAFAFAIWDNHKKRLLIARDPLGIKPVYYGEFDGRLFFSSELRALLAHPFIPRYLNVKAIHQFLHLGYVPGPETIVERVRKIPPGHYLICDSNGAHLERYWKIPPLNEEASDELFLRNELGSRISESVRLELNEDEPNGVLLSGGIDSSLIACLAKKFSATPLMTFTLQCADVAERMNANLAGLIRKKLNTRHFEITLSASDFRRQYLKTIWYLDEPLADPAAIAYFQLIQFVRQNLTSVLGGEGSDELLGGKQLTSMQNNSGHQFYFTEFSRKSFTEKQIYRLPRMKHRHNFSMMNSEDDGDYFGLNQPLDFAEEKLYSNQMLLKLKGYKEQLLPFENLSSGKNGDLLEKVLAMELSVVFPNTVLLRRDRLSAGAGVIHRTPFLNPNFIDFSFRIPYQLKVKEQNQKYLLRLLARDLLPPEIIRNSRSGWQIPVSFWLANQLKEWPNELLLNERAFSRGVFNPERIKQLVLQQPDNRPESTKLVFSLMCLESWFRLFIDGDSVEESEKDIKISDSVKVDELK